MATESPRLSVDPRVQTRFDRVDTPESLTASVDPADDIGAAEPNQWPGPGLPRRLPERFLVAFSFAGEQRELVQAIAHAVEARLGPGTVFLDDWYEHYLAGANADLKLQSIYGERSDLVVICISARYGGKAWTQAEHEAIRARLMRSRESTDERDRDAILPLRVGDGEVPGIHNTTIAPDVRSRAPGETADLILARLWHVRPDFWSAVPAERASPTASGSAQAGGSDSEYLAEPGVALAKILDHREQLKDIFRLLNEPNRDRHVVLVDAAAQNDWPEYLVDHINLDPWPEDYATTPRHELDIRQGDEEGFWQALMEVAEGGSAAADPAVQRDQVRRWVNARGRVVLYAPVVVERDGWQLPRLVRSAQAALETIGAFNAGARLLVLFVCFPEGARAPFWWPWLDRLMLRRTAELPAW